MGKVCARIHGIEKVFSTEKCFVLLVIDWLLISLRRALMVFVQLSADCDTEILSLRRWMI